MPSPPRSPYDVLGVPADASESDIRRAFRALAKELHPDVAGNDAARTERFKEVAAAYDTLSDTDKRAAYDRSQVRRSAGPRVWNNNFRARAEQTQDGRTGPRPPPNQDLDLEDLFTDFQASDFGFGRGGRRREEPRPGRDVSLTVDVPADVAARGGTLPVHYSRLKRAEGAITLVRCEELHDLRIPPYTTHGSTLRVERLGDAGEYGGPYGDLVADVRVVGEARTGDGRRAEAPGEEVRQVDITVAEAILGGRVPVVTPQGTVKVAIPAGTSSGTRFRLRGKGAAGDLVAEVRIVVPRHLDEESRRLIERFAELNARVEEG